MWTKSTWYVVAYGIAVFWGTLYADDKMGGRDDEKQKLEGTWLVISQKYDGEAVSSDDIKNEQLKIIIKQNEIIFMANGFERSKATWVIDPMMMPKEITLTHIKDDVKGMKAVGIYDIDGDNLKLCLGPADKDRPTKFDSTRGSGYIFHNLKREKKEK